MQNKERMFCEDCLNQLEETSTGIMCPKCGTMITNEYTILLWNRLGEKEQDQQQFIEYREKFEAAKEQALRLQTKIKPPKKENQIPLKNTHPTQK